MEKSSPGARGVGGAAVWSRALRSQLHSRESIHSNSRSRSSSRRQQSRPVMPPRSNASSAAISWEDNTKATATFAAILVLDDDFGITAQPFWRAHLSNTHADEDECALAALRTAGWSNSAGCFNAFQWPSFVSCPPSDA